MSENRIHNMIPSGNQLQPQSQGDVSYLITVRDAESDRSLEMRNMLSDVLLTDTYLKFIDITSEGRIEGPVHPDNPLQDVFLNGNPVADTSGKVLFDGVKVHFFNGTEMQNFPSMFEYSGAQINLMARIRKNTPIVITINDAPVTSVLVIIKLPSLFRQVGGGTKPTSVTLQFTIDGNLIAKKVISGKATSAVERSFKFDLARFSKPTTIVVQRVTEDSETLLLSNETYVSSYIKMVDYPLNYANRAGYAISFESKQFGTQQPDRSYLLKGINTIKVPDNYDPVSKTYTGIWTGIFKEAYTDNPVWCMLDAMTNKRYGAGNFIDIEDIDTFGMLEVARYCDDKVPGLRGVLEPRFTFNALITDSEKALSMFKKMLSNFVSMMFYSNGMIHLVQDKPEEPVCIVTNSNVTDDGFNYASIEIDKQCNTVLVTYNDPKNSYRMAIETVRNNKLLNEVGVEVKKEIHAYGCTSRSQANRLGRYQLLSDVLNSETVMYTAAMDHAGVSVGEIVEIHDNNMPYTVSSGRIVSMVDTIIVLDRVVSFLSGVSYVLHILNDNAVMMFFNISPITIGDTKTVHIFDSRGFTASKYSVYAITNNLDKKGELFKVMSIEEKEVGKFNIIGNKYNKEKFDLIYSNAPIDEDGRVPMAAPVAPYSIFISKKTLHIEGKTVLNDTDFSWDNVKGATHYEYQYDVDGSGFSEIKTTEDTAMKVIGGDGIYDIKVRSSDLLNRKSKFTEKRFSISMSSFTPADVAGFGVHRQGAALLFNWHTNPPSEFGLLEGYEVRIGEYWQTAQKIFISPGNSHVYTSNSPGTFLIKAKTLAGTYSLNAGKASAGSGKTNVVDVENYGNQGYPSGTLNNFTRVSGNKLQLLSYNYSTWVGTTQEWETLTDPWVGAGYIGLFGSYEPPVKDLGKKVKVFLKSVYTKSSTATEQGSGIYWTDVKDLYWTDVKQWYWPGITDPSSVVVHVKMSDDDITYTDYSEFVPGEYDARFFKYKISMMANAPAYLLYLDSFIVEYDIPAITENVKILTDSVTGKFHYTFNHTNFTIIPTVNATAEATIVSSNVKINLTNVSKTSADIETVDTLSGAARGGIYVNLLVRGY